jgi:dTDP-4-amino-4,6-dideoxygalactose transaminase
MNVPFLDLKTPHQKLESELVEVFRDCLRNASFIGGPRVQAFEEEFARFCETKYCVGVNSGTDALRFALIAAGIGPGDEVITVPNTFIATTEAISQVGASIGFVDIDERTYNLDPNKLEDYLKFRIPHSAIRNRPKTVIPVHLYGQPADMDAIEEIAQRYELIVIEDACQAHGALYHSRKENKWRKAGSMGLAAAFSFYPGKNLGACGEGGAVTTNDEKIAQKIRMIRDHGQAKKYYHDMEGYNGRLDAIQAGFLSIKLKSLPEWNEKRRRNASIYSNLFNLHPTPNTLIPPYVPHWAKPVYHLYIARASKRDELQKYLGEKGIGTGLHYPIPLHLQNAYSGNSFNKGDYPVTEKVSKEILSLPMFPELNQEQIEYVVEKINEFYKKA